MPEERGHWRVDEGASRKPAGKGRAAEAAARTYLRKNLGWLRGFPVAMTDERVASQGAASSGAPSWGVAWVVLPRLGSADQRAELIVSRELLRWSEFCRNAAPRKFPRALARVVGDVDEWSARIETRLKWLKASVHAGKAPPGLEALLDGARTRRFITDRVGGIVGRHQGLRPVAASLVWLHWGDEEAFLAALAAVEKHAASLESVAARVGGTAGLTLALHCIQMLADGCGGTLVELLADWRSWEIPLSRGDLHCRLKKCLDVKKDQDIEKSLTIMGDGLDRPADRMGPELVEFAFSLGAQGKPVRIRRLQMLEALEPRTVLGEWERWWSAYDGFERRARSLLNAGRRWVARETAGKCHALADEIDAGLELPPLGPWRRVVSGSTGPMFTEMSSKAFADLLRCIGLLSGHRAGKTFAERFLDAWDTAFDEPDRKWGVIEQLLAAQRGLLERVAPLGPTAQVWACDLLTEKLIQYWIETGGQRRLIEPVMETLTLMASRAETLSIGSGPLVDYMGFADVMTAVEFAGSPEVAAAMLEKAPPMAGGPHGKAWEILLRLSGGSAERFGALGGNWQDRNWTSGALRELDALIKEPGVAELAVGSLLDGEGKRLSWLAVRSALNRALALSRDEKATPEQGRGLAVEAAAFDITPYPVELHDLLAKLGQVVPDAAETADRILSQDYPLPSRMRAELGFLREEAERSEGARRKALAARMAKLEARLAAPVRAPGQRLGKYRAKLERRLRHFQLLQWEERLTGQIGDGLREKLGVEPPEDWLQNGEIMGVIIALAELPLGFRELAFRLLKARCGPEPWDLRDEGPNRSFLAEVERRGIRTQPWLDGLAPREIRGVVPPLWLAMEKDPLQIMRMGEPFDTCLSPRSFNFYSAVTNAADINKRVLYARDAEGVIRGRCLLALTNEGQVLTFRVYAHADQKAIEKAVAGYALELAGAMGSGLAAEAEIKELVATRWYDDGSVDLTKQWGFLHPDSEFMNELKTLPVGEVIGALERRAGPGGVSPRMVCRLIDTEVFGERPELSVALYEHLGASFAVHPYWRLRLCRLLREAGARQAALAVLQPVFGMNFRDDVHMPASAAVELIELGKPEQALRLLRQTRHSSVRDWSGDISVRLNVAAKAMEALGRPRQALELYRIAAKESWNKEAAERAAKLETILAARQEER